MKQYIDKDDVVAEIKTIYNEDYKFLPSDIVESVRDFKDDLLIALDALEVKESDETAEAFAKIIRANLTSIDKDVQYKFEQLYEKITGEKMYQGFKD